MLDTYIVVSVVLALIFVVLGFLVATRNINSNINRLFLSFSIFVSAWLVTNYLAGSTENGETAALVSNKLVFSFGILTTATLLFFVKSLTARKTNLFWILALVANLLFAVLSFTPLVVGGVELVNNTVEVAFGPMAAGYFTLLLINLILIVFVAVRARRRTTGQLKSQINIILFSLAITLGGVIIANGLIPFIFGYYGLANSGALLTTILVLGIGYSMVKHRLFDVRPFVARSAAYILLLATLSALFAGILFTLTSLFFADKDIGRVFQVVYLLLALILALILQPLKKFFDRATNRLFYRDAYDPQELLNTLNKSLVTTIEIEDLLNRSGSIIKNTLKINYCGFVIKENNNPRHRISGLNEQIVVKEDLIPSLDRQSNLTSRRVVITDDLGPNHQRLKELMQSADSAALVKLQGTAKGHNQHPGFILLGQKKSGGLYSSQDVAVLEIIADELVIAIQNALRFEEIQQFNITLRKKIDEATHELRRVNSRLRELDKTKDEFISMASHQLRTPLTAVKGYLSMILEGDTGSVKKDQKEMIQRSYDGAQKMVYLIADMLNVSRLQTGKFVIDNKPAYLPDVVQGEVDQLKEEIASKKIELKYEKPNQFPTLNLDETKIRQVIMNFLDNALYYTPSGGQIEVKLESTDETANFSIKDNGVGVPKSVQHHLFSKFYRADNARKMRPDGTGLGLYMAKKVVTAQGGAIIFKSEEGKGSTFGFSFPRKTTEVITKK